MANFNPRHRKTGNKNSIRTGLSGASVADGDLLVNAVSGHLSFGNGTTEVPIASDIIVTCAVNADADVTATTAPIHRLAIITDGVASTPGDGLVRSVAGKTPNSSGAVSLTYTDVGAAASSHTHTLSQITDGLTTIDKIGRVGTANATTSWTGNAGAYEQTVIISGLSTNLSTSSVCYVDIDTKSVTQSAVYEAYLQNWQNIWKIDYASGTSIKLYSRTIFTTAVPIIVTVLNRL